jgi:uncharacterized protein (TIGR03083 family)
MRHDRLMDPVPAATPLVAFAAEAANLSAALETVTEAEYDRPTRCTPWTVRALLAHVGMATGRVLAMLAEPVPATADTDAAGYYRPDTRFSIATNDERVDSALATALRAGTGAALAARFAASWRDAYASLAAQPPDRLVRTRHGDAMLLTDFLVTRVVELAIHGLDLADALDRPPWIDATSIDVVTRLLVGEAAGPTLDALGWDRVRLLRVATGRVGDNAGADVERLRATGITWLTLG